MSFPANQFTPIIEKGEPYFIVEASDLTGNEQKVGCPICEHHGAEAHLLNLYRMKPEKIERNREGDEIWRTYRCPQSPRGFIKLFND